MTELNRELAIDAVDTLNDLIGDLVAGTLVLLEYHQRFEAEHIPLQKMTAVQKMCLSHLVLSFVKLLEFWERCHQIVPAEHRDDLKALNRILKKKGVEDFRNKVAGHVWDRRLGRPLRNSEINARLEVLTDGHLGEFLRWVNNLEGNTYPRTVLSVVETIRNSLMIKYKIQPEEIIGR